PPPAAAPARPRAASTRTRPSSRSLFHSTGPPWSGPRDHMLTHHDPLLVDGQAVDVPDVHPRPGVRAPVPGRRRTPRGVLRLRGCPPGSLLVQAVADSAEPVRPLGAGRSRPSRWIPRTAGRSDSGTRRTQPSWPSGPHPATSGAWTSSQAPASGRTTSGAASDCLRARASTVHPGVAPRRHRPPRSRRTRPGPPRRPVPLRGDREPPARVRRRRCAPVRETTGDPGRREDGRLTGPRRCAHRPRNCSTTAHPSRQPAKDGSDRDGKGEESGHHLTVPERTIALQASYCSSARTCRWPSARGPAPPGARVAPWRTPRRQRPPPSKP
ncbi:hypothetical protein K353_04997, partial [Kitasatospora sp. SolWspMP-SS2h]